jgi:Tfp pilus assembly protein PilF
MVSIGLLWQCDHVVGIWTSDETLFQHALLIEPENNYLAHRALGDFYCDEQKVEQAVYHYTEALRCIPESSDSIVNSARELLRNGETTRAVVFVRAGLEADETDPSLWLMLGNAMLAVRNPNEAKQCFHRAITYNPSSSEAFNNLGLLEQDPAKAAELFSSAIRFDSRNAPAYVNLGNVFARQRQFGRAADCYRVAIELADLPEAHANLQAVTPLIQNE